MTEGEVVLVLMTHPAEGAESLARLLVERGLAACVQVLPGVRSTYRWKGSVESTDESRLEAKTTRPRVPALLAAVMQAHPYEVPEVLVLRVDDGLPAYLDWVRATSAVSMNRNDAE